jgi:hypothetical protein
MRLIKKSEKILLNKIKGMEEIEETNIQDDIIDAPESKASEKQVLDE